MSHNPRVHAIKRAQKEKLLLREISHMIHELSLEHPSLRALTVTRSALSPDKSMFTIFLYAENEVEGYKEPLEILKLYRPSMRKTLAQKITGRYVPDIRFAYDTKYTKQARIEQLMEQIKTK
ncbi:MAG: ribosome-binding factor A [Candidatus Babeliales bacterium]